MRTRGALILAMVLFCWWQMTTRMLHAQVPLPTTAQAEATKPGVPPAPVPPSETLSWSLTLGILANALMKKLKDSHAVRWIEYGSGRINFVLAAVLAALSAAGIHTEFDRVTWGFTITGNVMGIMHFGGDWLRQWAIQQLTYQSMKPVYEGK